MKLYLAWKQVVCRMTAVTAWLSSCKFLFCPFPSPPSSKLSPMDNLSTWFILSPKSWESWPGLLYARMWEKHPLGWGTRVSSKRNQNVLRKEGLFFLVAWPRRNLGMKGVPGWGTLISLVLYVSSLPLYFSCHEEQDQSAPASSSPSLGLAASPFFLE